MYKTNEKWDISHNNGIFSMSAEDIWQKGKNYLKYIHFNPNDNTFSIIPSLENLEKRLMLLIVCSIKEKFGFGEILYRNFILELPKTFQKIMESLDFLEFEFCIFKHIFKAELNYSASHLEITYEGRYNDYSDEFLYDVATTLYGSNSTFDTTQKTNQSFWED